MIKSRKMIVIIFILLSSITISTTHGLDLLKTCNPSRCGDQVIREPFRLKGDPANCGDHKYQLSCIANKTFLAAPYDKYLVTNIFYHGTINHYYNDIIEIVHSDLESGKCSLPSQAITPSFHPQGFDLRYIPDWYAVINCSEKLENGYITEIPCLSQNNRFIYLVKDGTVSSLPVSCRYLTMVPISYHVDLYNINIGDDIFHTLKREIIVLFVGHKYSRSEIIHVCFRDAVTNPMNDMVEQLTAWSGWIKFPFRIPINFLVWIKIPFLIPNTFLYCISHDLTLYGYPIRNGYYLNHAFYAIAICQGLISLGLAMILGRLIIAPICIYIFLLRELIKKLSSIDYIEAFLRNQQRTTLTRYAYGDIVAISRHFKDRLGQGGFGTVYKGELPGDYLVAVKLLGKSNDNGDDFINEVSTIGTIHHANVVRLIGFCSEGLHRALVYEYMYNGSLDKYIFSSTKKFTTKKLNEIALGVARGIDYIHQGCDMRILHFDIKPHNILLDSNFNPKVSDFGLAKLYSKDKSLISSFATRGTIGYMAPELISRSFGLISYKSDVYSYGMLLLEMVGGRRNYDSRVLNSSQAYYPSWIYDELNQEANLNVLDHEVEIIDTERKLCKIGLWCIQMSPSSRPTMSRVIEMLGNDVDDVEMPPKPFFFSSSQHTTRGKNSFQTSSNEISTIYENE